MTLIRKTLLISYTLPPSPTGSATVIANLCRQFSKNEIVITGAKNYGSNTIFDWIDSPTVKYTSWRTKPFRGAGLIRFICLPLTFLLTVYYYYKYRCGNIIAIYPNNEFFILGWLVSKVTNAKFYPYLHNTFADNIARTSWRMFIFNHIELLIFKGSKVVLLISDGLKLFYQNKYKDRFIYLSIKHTINEKNHPLPKKLFVEGKRIKYLFVGSINESNSDAALRLIRCIYAIDGSEVLIRSGTHEKHLRSAGLYDCCTIIPELSRIQLMELLCSVDVLLLPHGFHGKLSSVEYETIFPTKTVEYLFAGRPILAHCSESCFLFSFLLNYNCAFVITSTEADVIIGKINEFNANKGIQTTLVQNARLAGMEFDAYSVACILKAALQA